MNSLQWNAAQHAGLFHCPLCPKDMFKPSLPSRLQQDLEVHMGKAITFEGNDFSVSYLRLMAPPLQLFSAAMWQVVQQGLVDHYGMLEEFVTMVTELAPQLMDYSHRAQLILGLRARLVLELCRGEQPLDIQTVQPHLDRIKAPISTAKDHHETINQVEESEVNFVELVHTLLEDPTEREHFFQEIFPVHFGSKYDTALEMLLWEFISRLDELLPVPDFTQMVAWLVDIPSFLNNTLQSFSQQGDMKEVLEHNRNLGHIEEKDPNLLPMDDCILASLSLPPMARLVLDSASRLPSPDPLLPEVEGQAEARQMKEKKDPSEGRLNVGSVLLEQRAQNTNSTTSPVDISVVAEPAANEDVHISRGGRKRRSSSGLEAPLKQPAKVTVSLDSSMEVEASGESPLISIWGEYTDSQESSFTVINESKVPWSDNETLHLLDIWGKDSVQRGLRGCLKNRHIFTLISRQMAERGFLRTVEQCQTRIKRLKNGFRRCLQSKKGNPRLEFKFYDQLEPVLGSHSAVPEVTYEIGEGMEDGQSPDEDAGEDLQFLCWTSGEEIGTRSVPWSDSETMALVNIWGEHQVQQELRGAHRTGHIYVVISEKMAARGFSRTAEQCQTRMRRLKGSFRQCYENNTKGKEQVKCKFYDQLGRILIKDLSLLEGFDESNNDLDLELRHEEPTDNDFSTASLDREIASSSGERRNVPWSDKETVILLELWGDHQVQQSLRLGPHNGHIFTEISEKLSASGFPRSPEQCHTRVKRLKASYRQCQESIRTGTDEVDFKFYDLLEQILEKQPSTSTLLVTDPIEISEDSNGDSMNGTDGEMSASTGKTTSGVWSDEQTLALISIWGEEEVQRPLRGYVHNGHVYADISEQMHQLGYAKSPEQCRWKVKSLRANFRQCYDRKKSGRNKVEYKFYTQLQGILGREAAAMDEYEEKDKEEDQDIAGPDETNSGPWCEQETVALIELWADEDVQTSLSSCIHNGHIYVDISNKMAVLGYLRSAEQCQTKIKNLKKTYRRFCNSRRSGGHPTLFTYYPLMEPVLGDGPPLYAAGDTPAGDSSMMSLLDTEEALCELSASTNQLPVESSRKMLWSELETETLLEVWADSELPLSGSAKNQHIYDDISEKMREQGFIRTTEQCYSRLKRLKAAYRHDKKDFKFHDQMDKIFKKKMRADDVITGEAGDLLSDEDTASSTCVKDSSNIPWSDGETELLLNTWGSEEVQQELRKANHTKPLYALMSRAMAAQGFLRTGEQCQRKLQRLKAIFRQFVVGKKGEEEQQECKFFDQLLDVFGSEYVNADHLASASVEMTVSAEASNSPSP